MSDADKVLLAALINGMSVTVQVTLQAMLAENEARRRGGSSAAYTENNFFQIAEEFTKQVVLIRKEYGDK